MIFVNQMSLEELGLKSAQSNSLIMSNRNLLIQILLQLFLIYRFDIQYRIRKE
jgi:hypothetical protein